MPEKPIIFSTPTVQAILAGHKTQTRLALKPQPKMMPHPEFGDSFWFWRDCEWLDGGIGMPESAVVDYAPYKPGDTLWVRETWCEVPYEHTCERFPGGVICSSKVAYKADSKVDYTGIYRPPLSMPREAARLFLRVVDVRCERLQDISETDAIAEGIIECEGHKRGDDCGCASTMFRKQWNELNVKRGFGWGTNPWVWVIELERIGTNGT